MNNALMFGRATDEWSTPQTTFDALDAEFQFDIDLAATPENAKCPVFYHAGVDALSIDWSTEDPSVCHGWLNPPYSKCREFIAKAAQQAKRGFTTVCLVPSRTDTQWWHEHVWNRETHQARPGVEIRFLKGRLKFGGATAGAPFPSVVIIFRPVRTA